MIDKYIHCIYKKNILVSTSVHDSSGMHVLKSATNLCEILPYSPLWDEPLLLLEMLERKEVQIVGGSSCGRADSVMDSHTTGPGFKTWLVRYFLPSF